MLGGEAVDLQLSVMSELVTFQLVRVWCRWRPTIHYNIEFPRTKEQQVERRGGEKIVSLGLQSSLGKCSKYDEHQRPIKIAKGVLMEWHGYKAQLREDE